MLQEMCDGYSIFAINNGLSFFSLILQGLKIRSKISVEE